MIRVLHLADLHLGVENYGRVDPETGLSSRVRDFLDRLDELSAFALEEKVDLVVFAGDVFRNRRPEPTYQRDFGRRIVRLAQQGIPVILVAGNHDLATMPVKATSVDIFRALAVENVYVSARREEVFTLSLKSGRTLQVATFPYPARNRLLLSEEYRHKSLREQEEFFRTHVAQSLARLAEQVDPERPAILVAHMMVLGANPGTEQRMKLGYEIEALIGSLAHPVYDAVLLGHVHQAQVLRAEAPVVLYAGSLERVDFGDEGIEKGFYLIEIGEEAAEKGRRPVSYRFVPLQARPFLTLEVEGRSGRPMERALNKIEEAVAANQIADAVVRLRLRVREEDAGSLDIPALRRALKDAFFVAAVAVDVERSERATFRGSLDEIGPLEALERYWISRGVSAGRRQVLLHYAQELLTDEAELH